jgi:hypothetical protein
MSGKRWWFLATLILVAGSSGCCRWCDRWCNRGVPVQQCVPCCPVAAAPAPAPVCCPTPAPTCYAPGTGAVAGQQWQRTPGVAAACCP